jgi:hypothetical protein
VTTSFTLTVCKPLAILKAMHGSSRFSLVLNSQVLVTLLTLRLIRFDVVSLILRIRLPDLMLKGTHGNTRLSLGVIIQVLLALDSFSLPLGVALHVWIALCFQVL